MTRLFLKIKNITLCAANQAFLFCYIFCVRIYFFCVLNTITRRGCCSWRRRAAGCWRGGWGRCWRVWRSWRSWTWCACAAAVWAGGRRWAGRRAVCARLWSRRGGALPGHCGIRGCGPAFGLSGHSLPPFDERLNYKPYYYRGGPSKNDLSIS